MERMNRRVVLICAVVIVGVYLLLNTIVVGSSLMYLLRYPELFEQWLHQVNQGPEHWHFPIHFHFGSGILALRSGEAEEDRVERVVAERFIEEHEEAAELFVWSSGGVLVLMLLAGALGSRRSALPAAAVATVGTLVVLGLGYRTGQAGGSLVYEQGAGQAYTGARAPTADPPTEFQRRDDD